MTAARYFVALGPVARSLVSANRWLRGIKCYRFPWYLTLVSAKAKALVKGRRHLKIEIIGIAIISRLFPVMKYVEKELKIVWVLTGEGGGGEGYLGQFSLGMCHWSLRTPTPL